MSPVVPGHALRAAVLLTWLLFAGITWVQGDSPVELRGIVTAVRGDVVALKERNGETIEVQLVGQLLLQQVQPGDPAAFKAGARDLLKPGVGVFIVAVQRRGRWAAHRLVVGQHRFPPPM
jgi:hypothetical protein